MMARSAVQLPVVDIESVADSLKSSGVTACITWSKKDAVDRCTRVEKWTKSLPSVVDKALCVRRTSAARVTQLCLSFGLTLSWDPALSAMPACSSFKLPRSMHLVYKLRFLVESVLKLKFEDQLSDIYNRESSLCALQRMSPSRLGDWKAMLKAFLDWGKSTMALIYAAHAKRNVFAPEFLEVFRLAFVPLIHDSWLLVSLREKSCFCEIIAAVQHECWSSAHSFVFPKQILYVLCVPFTKLVYAGYSKNPKERMDNHYRQMNSRFAGSQLAAYAAFRSAPYQPSPIPAANVFSFQLPPSLGEGLTVCSVNAG